MTENKNIKIEQEVDREKFITFIDTHTTTWKRLFKYPKYQAYVKFMHSWCELLETDFFTDTTRVYWIKHDLHEFPLSKIWKKPIVKMRGHQIRHHIHTYQMKNEDRIVLQQKNANKQRLNGMEIQIILTKRNMRRQTLNVMV